MPAVAVRFGLGHEHRLRSRAEYLGDPPLAMAFLDRVVDGAILLKIRGKSACTPRTPRLTQGGQVRHRVEPCRASTITSFGSRSPCVRSWNGSASRRLGGMVRNFVVYVRSPAVAVRPADPSVSISPGMPTTASPAIATATPWTSGQPSAGLSHRRPCTLELCQLLNLNPPCPAHSRLTQTSCQSSRVPFRGTHCHGTTKPAPSRRESGLPSRAQQREPESPPSGD